MGFWSKNKEKTEEFKVIDYVLDSKIAGLKADIDRIEQGLKTLRGLVNRKLGNEEPKERETETSKYPDAFDSMRKNGIF